MALRKHWGYLGQSLISAVFILLAVGAMYYALKDIELDKLMASIFIIPPEFLLLACIFSLCSYSVLIAYDLAGIAYVKKKVPFWVVARTALTAYAIGNNTGASVLSGGAIRYRMYSPAGLTAPDIATVVLMSTVTFSLGLIMVCTLLALSIPHIVSHFLFLPPFIIRLLGILGVILITIALTLSYKYKAKIRIFKWSLPLPGFKLLLAQLIIPTIEIFFSALILYILLPPHTVPFLLFMGIFALAIAIGFISHVPGGLGVMEAILIFGIGHLLDKSTLMACIIVYRFFYNFIPLVLAGGMLIVYELFHHKKNIAKKTELSE